MIGSYLELPLLGWLRVISEQNELLLSRQVRIPEFAGSPNFQCGRCTSSTLAVVSFLNRKLFPMQSINLPLIPFSLLSKGPFNPPKRNPLQRHIIIFNRGERRVKENGAIEGEKPPPTPSFFALCFLFYICILSTLCILKYLVILPFDFTYSWEWCYLLEGVFSAI